MVHLARARPRRATELVGTCPWLLTRSRPLELYWGDNPGLLWWIYGPRVRGAWANRTDHLGLRFESPPSGASGLAFWKRYKRAVRLEHGKSLKRQHRATVEAMIHDEGLLEELPDDVTGWILEFLYKPTAADKRDERSYKQFRRRPRNSMTMDPFEAFENRRPRHGAELKTARRDKHEDDDDAAHVHEPGAARNVKDIDDDLTVTITVPRGNRPRAPCAPRPTPSRRRPRHRGATGCGAARACARRSRRRASRTERRGRGSSTASGGRRIRRIALSGDADALTRRPRGR